MKTKNNSQKIEVYQQNGENRKSGVYCGNSGVLQETPRGSPAKQAYTI